MRVEQPYKKFIDKVNVSDWEILTDKGFMPIKNIGKTVPYDVVEVKTETGKSLRCADTHILFDTEYDEIFAKDLNKQSRPDYIYTVDGPELVTSVEFMPEQENMFDIEVDSEKHRYYTNGFLSHNSIFLCNDAVSFVKAGKNVVFITCEMSAKKVIKRIGANMLNISIDNYDRASIDTDNMCKKLFDARQKQIMPMGQLFIKEYPTSCCTASDIENYIKKIQEVHKFKVNVVVVDYINIMADYRSNDADMYNKIKNISEQLRAVAVRQECLIISATQTNRSAFDSNEITMSNVAESAGLIYTADTMFGIIQDSDMRLENKYLLKILKIRDGKGKNNKLEMRIDYDKMRIEETGWYYPEDSNEPVRTADAEYRPGSVKPSSPHSNYDLLKKDESAW